MSWSPMPSIKRRHSRSSLIWQRSSFAPTGCGKGKLGSLVAVAFLLSMLVSMLGESGGCRTGRIGGLGLTLLVGGLFAAVVFVVAGSPWLTVLLAAVGAVLLTVFEPVTWALIAELAGE